MSGPWPGWESGLLLGQPAPQPSGLLWTWSKPWVRGLSPHSQRTLGHPLCAGCKAGLNSWSRDLASGQHPGGPPSGRRAQLHPGSPQFYGPALSSHQTWGTLWARTPPSLFKHPTAPSENSRATRNPSQLPRLRCFMGQGAHCPPRAVHSPLIRLAVMSHMGGPEPLPGLSNAPPTPHRN